MQNIMQGVTKSDCLLGQVKGSLISKMEDNKLSAADLQPNTSQSPLTQGLLGLVILAD